MLHNKEDFQIASSSYLHKSGVDLHKTFCHATAALSCCRVCSGDGNTHKLKSILGGRWVRKKHMCVILPVPRQFCVYYSFLKNLTALLCFFMHTLSLHEKKMIHLAALYFAFFIIPLLLIFIRKVSQRSWGGCKRRLSRLMCSACYVYCFYRQKMTLDSSTSSQTTCTIDYVLYSIKCKKTLLGSQKREA